MSTEQPKYSPACPVNAREQARAVLLRLPVELVFHFWDVILHQIEDSHEHFKKTLQHVPELAWTVEIITDDVDKWSSTYTGCTTSPRTITLSEHELERNSLETTGRHVRRIAVLFNCDTAMRNGTLSAYEGCRYGRLLLSPSLNAAYCLVPNHPNTTTNYLGELLTRFDAISEGKPGTVHLVQVPKPVLSNGVVEVANESISDETLESSTLVSSETTGRALEYRVVHSAPKCLMKMARAGRAAPMMASCTSPPIELTYDQLAPQVHIFFKLARTPTIKGPLNIGTETHNQHLGPVDSRVPSSRRFDDSVLSITNSNWSLASAGGLSTTCSHMDDSIEEWYPATTTPIMHFTHLYERLWYYGVSDLTMLLTCEANKTEVVWFRLSPYQFLPAYTSFLDSRVYYNSLFTYALERYALFSELTKKYRDMQYIPLFLTAKDVECVQLVALEKSDDAWALDQVLLTRDLRSLRSLELLQLRSSGRKRFRDPTPYLEIQWRNISCVLPFLQELTVGGYIPAFALANSDGGVFSCLRLLCLDVSPLASPEVDAYHLYLPEHKYPKLTHLYLKGVFGISINIDSYPALTLTRTCTVLGLSSVIRRKTVVNSSLLQIPEIPVVADVFNVWLLSKTTGEYVYAGAGRQSVTRRIEEVDEALRPI